jgi:hypothetical protein
MFAICQSFVAFKRASAETAQARGRCNDSHEVRHSYAAGPQSLITHWHSRDRTCGLNPQWCVTASSKHISNQQSDTQPQRLRYCQSCVLAKSDSVRHIQLKAHTACMRVRTRKRRSRRLLCRLVRNRQVELIAPARFCGRDLSGRADEGQSTTGPHHRSRSKVIGRGGREKGKCSGT